MRGKLRELLRVSRFQGWSVDKLEDEILKLVGSGEVEDQPAQPDQPPEPVVP